MWRLRWSIAVYAGATPFRLEPIPGLAPVLTAKTVTDIPCAAVADPFLLRRDGQWYMFFEALNRETDRGEIACATSPNCMHWTYGGSILREDFHLSYPYVFEFEGTIYMIPETRQANSIRLYAASAFPRGWTCVAELRSGPFADSSICRHDGRWWIFAQRGLDELVLLTSDRLESGWAPHPLSPIWEGNRVYTRPGGRMLHYQGAWHRFAQDGLESYGSNLRALRIDRLSATEYGEREIEESPILEASLKGWNAMGMHHLNAVEQDDGTWLGVVDGATTSL
jgi:hypothetical protein